MKTEKTQFKAFMDPEVKKMIRRLALEKGVSMSAYVETLLRKHIEKQQ